MALFESYERRIDKINGVLAQYGIGSVEECRELCKAKGFDPYEIVKGIQPICFENACWAYTVGAAIALKSGVKTAADAADGNFDPAALDRSEDHPALVALDRRNGESGNVLVFDDEPGVDLIGEIAQSGSEYDPHFGREILGPGSDESGGFLNFL